MITAPFPGLVTVDRYVHPGARLPWWRRVIGLPARPTTAVLFCRYWCLRSSEDLELGVSSANWFAVALGKHKENETTAEVLATIPAGNIRGIVVTETAPRGVWDLDLGGPAR